MSKEKTAKGRSQDRKLVTGGQDHEVSYETKKMNVSTDDVRKAVKSEGNSLKRIERQLKDK